MRHLYKSTIKYSYTEAIILNAESIVHHSNFNPRIIESYLNSDFDLEVDCYQYGSLFIDYLSEPFEFLDKIYKKQSVEAKLLLYLLLTIQDSILVKDLNELYRNAVDSANTKGRHLKNYNIESIIKQLEKTFIKTKFIEMHGVIIDFLNPSIRDYLFKYDINFFEFDKLL